MNIKKHIPNFLTCCNLLCGCLGILCVFYGKLEYASYLIFIAGIFDFFDGFVARVLHVSSPIGKELDSLADVVSFGLLPAFIIHKLLLISTNPSHLFPIDLVNQVSDMAITVSAHSISQLAFSSIAILIAIFSALRLAKFNIDTRQSDSFIGVNTPTNAMLIASFPLILADDPLNVVGPFLLNPYFLVIFTIIMSLLLVSELPLFAFKFKNFKWAENKFRFIFLILALLLFIIFLWTAIPMIVLLYIIMSIIENQSLKSHNTTI